MWSLGLRYFNFYPGLSAEIGVTNGPFVGTAKSGFVIGLNYAFNLCGGNTTTTPGGYGY